MKQLAAFVVVALLLCAGGWAVTRGYRAAEERKVLAQHKQERVLLVGQIENDRLALQSAELDEQIAEREGRSPNVTATQAARQRLQNDESLLSVIDEGDRFRATLR